MGVADFSGYATKSGLLCSDGKTLLAGAFKHQDKQTVPLVWQHDNSSPENVLGHAVLEDRADGTYTYAYFNDSPTAQNAKLLVEHGDINALSIRATGLKYKGNSGHVAHGDIREVSLVLAGANPGAFIDTVNLQHSEDGDEDDAATIYTGLTLEHEAGPGGTTVSTTTTEKPVGEKTVQEIFDSLNEEQKTVVTYIVDEALKAGAAGNADAAGTAGGDAAQHEDDSKDTIQHSQEGTDVTHKNVFENDESKDTKTATLSHEDVKGIVADALRSGSLRNAVQSYALSHGIQNLDVLFPDAKAVDGSPAWVSRRMEWVAGVLSGVRHSPFARIKSRSADITLEDARAKGYIKGHMKKEEFFSLAKRETYPKTIYKKQKLDRDDIIDATELDIVSWMKGEMRVMLDEEIARAILIGDGRDVADEDKIDEDKIRPIATDNDFYNTTLTVNVDDANSDYNEVIDAIVDGMRFYKGQGSPVFYTSLPQLTKFLLLKDGFKRRLYKNAAEVADALGVSRVVTVEVMETVPDLIGVIVNLNDYVVGTDRGGEVTLFDDFDIDFNQNKYLIETRFSGALVTPKSALTIRKAAAAAVLAVPEAPTFAANVITPKTTTGVTYKRSDTNATVTTAAPITLTAGQSLTIYAVPESAGYFFANNAEDSWTFTYKA